MRFLFVHQAFPTQYRYLAPHLAEQPGNEVVALTDEDNVSRYPPHQPGVKIVGYIPPAPGNVTSESEDRERSTIERGRAVERGAVALRNAGFLPDVILAHPGWGEALFLKDVFPQARMIAYCEFFSRTSGADIGFDPQVRPGSDAEAWVRAVNMPFLAALAASDCGVAPMFWQKQQFPPEYHDRIRVIHDGIDTDTIAPQDSQTDEELVTYAARNLEPYRGFHVFMRAVPEILKRRPRARVAILGGDKVNYSPRLPAGETYRQRFLREIAGKADLSRVHFMGPVPFLEYLATLRRSSAHVYLTYPFVLSWSLLEAMSAGCAIVGSRTPPVEEVISDGVNGLLADFFSPEDIAAKVDDALSRRHETRALREQARRTIVDRYDALRVCLPEHLKLIEQVVSQ